MRAYTCAWYLVLGVLVLNSVLSVLSPGRNGPDTPTDIATRTTSEYHPHCCSCRPSLRLNQPVNYSHIASLKPTLSAEYRTTTLTRLGTDLNFDLSQCPHNSLMKSISPAFTPAHLDCPTLFLVGARKGGTSSLYHYVSKHPDFEGTRLDRGPKVGETFFFSRYFNETNWKLYLQSFPSDGVMTGDASVGNLVSCEAPKRIYKMCGKQARIVMLLRDPVNRFQSNFLMRARLDTARVTNTTGVSTVLKLHLSRFLDKILQKQVDITRLPEQWNSITCLFQPAANLVNEGVYYVHLMNWLCNFPAENILIINSEEFYRKPAVILDQVFQFLGLKRLDEETYHWITAEVYNRGQHGVLDFQSLSNTERRNLNGVYKPLNKALFSLLDWTDVSW